MNHADLEIPPRGWVEAMLLEVEQQEHDVCQNRRYLLGRVLERTVDFPPSLRRPYFDAVLLTAEDFGLRELWCDAFFLHSGACRDVLVSHTTWTIDGIRAFRNVFTRKVLREDADYGLDLVDKPDAFDASTLEYEMPDGKEKIVNWSFKSPAARDAFVREMKRNGRLAWKCEV